jgi:hypothetical protein
MPARVVRQRMGLRVALALAVVGLAACQGGWPIIYDASPARPASRALMAPRYPQHTHPQHTRH